MSGVSRRSLIASGAAVAGAVAATQVLPGAAAAATTGTASEHASAGRRHGDVRDVKHVVVLMQENRSFDHYYGALRGVRGFEDAQALRYPDGSSIFAQPDPTRAGGSLLPFRMDTTRYDAQEATDLDHSWGGTHAAWNNGAWNRWVTTKGEEAMGYFDRADVPWQYALADAFTVCDGYFCSIQGPTTPNRLFLWTGTNDPRGTAGGPAIDNPDDYLPVYGWTTYPERLQEAGVSWQVYANTETGEGDWLGDYGDNPLWLFQQYHDAQASTDPAVHELALRGSVTPWQPDAGQGHAVDHVLERFIADCAAGTLPTVSWIVAPYRYSEHPQARPADGAAYTEGVLKALWANPELWASTAVLVTYDENDGFFDHVVPPTPTAGTTDEFVSGLPVGLGPRVPMTVISPWSRGGWVNSQTFDHTSVIRFLEVVTGVHEPNISAWRRAVCGDLTSCFDFGSFDPSVPHLPDTDALVARADAQKSLPPLPPPPAGEQAAPVQESGTRRHRRLPYRPDARLTVDRSGTATLTLTNDGADAVSFMVYDATATPFAGTPVLVTRSHRQQVTVSAAGGRYDLRVLGPDGFLRTFAGTIPAPGAAAVRAVAEVDRDHVRLTLSNTGRAAARFTVSDTAGRRRPYARTVGGDTEATVEWPIDDGGYDVTVAAGGYLARFAGRADTA